MENSEPPRDKRFDMLLFFVGATILFSTLDPSFFTSKNNYNSHQHIVVTNDKIKFICSFDGKSNLITAVPEFRPFFWGRIPINQADKPLLMTIRGIGPDLAEKIIKARKERGFLKNINDLTQIKGIGKRRAAYFKNTFDFGDSQ